MKSYATACLSLILFMSASAEQRIESPSEFIISSPKDTYAVYEPIQIIFTLTNHRDRQIEGDFGLGFDYSQLKVFYRRGDEEFHRYAAERTEMPREYAYGTKIPIPAHGQISGNETVLYDIRTNRFVFSEPGKYEFRATYNYVLNEPSLEIESNILRVMVLPLHSQESLEALSLWKDPYLARLLQGDSVRPLGDEVPLEERRKMVLEKLMALVENHPLSTYTQVAKEVITQRYEEKEKRGLLPEPLKQVLNLVRQVR